MQRETLDEAIEGVENLLEQISCDITEAAVRYNMNFATEVSSSHSERLSEAKILHAHTLNILSNLRNMSKYVK